MNVISTQTIVIIREPHVPTLLDPGPALVMMDIVEMALLVLVGTSIHTNVLVWMHFL